MRKLFILLFVANVALAVVSYMLLPDTVASHFRFDGIPDSWGSKTVGVLILLAIELVLFVVFLLVPSSVSWIPKRWVDLPNKDYWLKEENKPKLKAKLEVASSKIGIAILALCFCLGLLVLEANLSDPVRLNASILWAALIAFTVYTVYWCVKFFSFFNMPKNDETAGKRPNSDPVSRAL